MGTAAHRPFLCPPRTRRRVPPSRADRRARSHPAVAESARAKPAQQPNGCGVPRRAQEKWVLRSRDTHFSNCATFGKVAKPLYSAREGCLRGAAAAQLGIRCSGSRGAAAARRMVVSHGALDVGFGRCPQRPAQHGFGLSRQPEERRSGFECRQHLDSRYPDCGSVRDGFRRFAQGVQREAEIEGASRAMHRRLPLENREGLFRGFGEGQIGRQGARERPEAVLRVRPANREPRHVRR